MAQTTGAVSPRGSVVEVSTNGSVWTDISGFHNAIDPGDASRITGEAYTSDGDTAIILAGKREPIEVETKIIYTEGASDPFEVVRAAFEAASALYLRWTIKPSATGVFRYATAAGIVSKFKYPGSEAEDGKPIMTAFTLKVASVTKALVP